MENTSSNSFVHLHVHTQYSLLQGATRIAPLMQKAKEFEMPALAITDSNQIFGAIDFYFSAKSVEIKPIIGCEILFAPDGKFSVQQAFSPQGKAIAKHAFEMKVFKLVLLCKDLKGYQNLCELITKAYTDAIPVEKGQSAMMPRQFIDRDLLEKFKEGLIVLSGGLKGELAYRILMGEEQNATESIEWFKKTFEEDYYLELQDNGLPEQERVNDTLYDWSKKYGLKAVATSDCYYLEPKDAEAHEILQCIERGRNLDFNRPKSLVPPEYYFKSSQLMRERFSRYPEACDETLRIAEKCDLKFKFKDKDGNNIYHLPQFRPEGIGADEEFDLISYFKEESKKGLYRRFTEVHFEEKKKQVSWVELEKEYHARLAEELEMIAKTGFAGYFLIVADFINWAKERFIPVGPGRGSGAGSLVAYSLRITDIDPIEYKLLFERFINPERISMPDFDIDFCQDRREEVIDYVTKKYGASNVCQIITFGKLQARAVIKDVGRVLGLSFAETDQITKLLPNELNLKLDDAFQKEPALQEKIRSDEKLSKVFEYALTLEGLYRNAGVHAAGVIITEKPIVNYCPLFVGKDNTSVSQFDKDFGEKIGLIKFDFLGLKTLTVIDHAVKLVRESAEKNSLESKLKIENIRYSDPKVFALIGSGDTDGVFQVESSGMKDLCSRILPSSIEDLTTINALYRPGPLGSGMVDDFIDRKHGRKPIVYETPELEPILKETYGVILYQEQVMQIARVLAGYSLGQADLLRRAMGKKKPEEMAKHREIFVKGSVQNGLFEVQASSIFDLMAKFAEYGFNKSHSAAYAVLTYQTAYLKTYFPSEFMAALMTTEIHDTDKITKYCSDARAHHLKVLPPDVNVSERKFSVDIIRGVNDQSEKAIRFGLEALKGVGGVAVDEIIEMRKPEDGGPFKSVLDFCRRVSTRKVNKKVLESLIYSGALDAIAEVNRPSLLASIESLLSHASDEQAEKALGQTSLFDTFTEDQIKISSASQTQIFKTEEDWTYARKLALEKQVVGFFVSGHPLDHWQKILEDWLGWNTSKLKQYAEDRAGAPQPQGTTSSGGYQRPVRKEVTLGGLIGSELKEITTKKGAKMAFASLEDLYGKLEVIFFPEAYQTLQEKIKQATTLADPVVITGDLDLQGAEPKILARTLDWANEAHKNRVKQVILRLKPSQVSVGQMRELKQSLLQYRGPCSVRIDFEDQGYKTHMELPKNIRVASTPQLAASVNRIFGETVVDFL